MDAAITRDAAAASGFDTDGRLIYAIGDIHGRDDLAAKMIRRIVDDVEQRGRGDAPGAGERPVVIFLGDYVDRGRQSREVIARMLAFRADPRFEVRFLLGNHEEAMLDFLDRRTSGVGWTRRGGKQTIESYGVRVPHDQNDRVAWSRAREALAHAVPPDHVAFLRDLELTIGYGDIFFVHAGVRPGVALDAQDKTDMLWIRTEFLGHELPFGKLIVHGHTPIEKAFLGPHRIGLDTGAYASGLLSAARFDGTAPVLLEVRAGQAPVSAAA